MDQPPKTKSTSLEKQLADKRAKLQAKRESLDAKKSVSPTEPLSPAQARREETARRKTAEKEEMARISRTSMTADGVMAEQDLRNLGYMKLKKWLLSQGLRYALPL